MSTTRPLGLTVASLLTVFAPLSVSGPTSALAQERICAPVKEFKEPCTLVSEQEFHATIKKLLADENTQTYEKDDPAAGPDGPEGQFTSVNVIPRGVGKPANAADDLFGFALGASYEEVRQHLLSRVPLKLQFGSATPISGGRPYLVDENEMPYWENFQERWVKFFRIQQECGRSGCRTSGGASANAVQYRAFIKADNYEADGARETFTLRFSSPASGHQLVGLHYAKYLQEKQPLVSEFLSALESKFGAKPVMMSDTQAIIVHTKKGPVTKRFSRYGGEPCALLDELAADAETQTSRFREAVGRKEPCLLVVKLNWNSGISRDHMSYYDITFLDPSRLWANMVTDEKFILNSEDDRLKKVTAPKPQL